MGSKYGLKKRPAFRAVSCAGVVPKVRSPLHGRAYGGNALKKVIKRAVQVTSEFSRVEENVLSAFRPSVTSLLINDFAEGGRKCFFVVG